ncbi:MAG: helix-hairpin-helix domain-containing protein [Gemmatimonadetes bacterium]|nr:helix-hairpin-helix domain-containing protein [Gemmatimonadota bacterium]
MTKGEIQAILFVAVSMLAGGLVLLVKQFDSDFMPDLVPAAADGRLNAGIQGQSAQTTGNAMTMAGGTSGGEADAGGGRSGGGRSGGDLPYPQTLAPGADSRYLAPGVPSKSAFSNANLRVPINTAPASELQKLPGIGPTLAERIIAFREHAGSFARVEQLLEVKGIGPAKLDRLRPFVELP